MPQTSSSASDTLVHRHDSRRLENAVDTSVLTGIPDRRLGDDDRRDDDFSIVG